MNNLIFVSWMVWPIDDRFYEPIFSLQVSVISSMNSKKLQKSNEYIPDILYEVKNDELYLTEFWFNVQRTTYKM